MAIEKIQYGDNGKVAREKINNIFQEVEDNIPSIGENGDWYLGTTDTGTPAQGPEGPKGDKGETGDDGTDICTPEEYEHIPGADSNDVAYFIRN